MLANKKRYRPCDIGHGSPTLFVSCAHFSVNVGHWLPASVMACAHRSFTMESGLYASFRKILSWSERISKATLVVVCAHHSNDINSGMRASTKQHRRNTSYKSKGLHISIIMFASTRWHVRRLHALERWRRPTRVLINQIIHASDVVCVHLESNIAQQHASSSKDMHK